MNDRADINHYIVSKLINIEALLGGLNMRDLYSKALRRKISGKRPVRRVAKRLLKSCAKADWVTTYRLAELNNFSVLCPDDAKFVADHIDISLKEQRLSAGEIISRALVKLEKEDIAKRRKGGNHE